MNDLEIMNNSNIEPGNEVGAISAQAREQSEIQAQVIMAKRCPRDEEAAVKKAVKSFLRPAMAECAQYSFKKGKKQTESGQWVDNFVTGPTIDLAKEAARCWGNLRFGKRIVSFDLKEIHIKGYCFDLETNAYSEHEDKFERLIERKQGREIVKVFPNERDLRELINRRGAFVIRNAILDLLPPDMVDEIIETSETTLSSRAKEELGSERQETIDALKASMLQVGVSPEMLEKRLGHSLNTITASDLAEFRRIRKSIKQGHTAIEEAFPFEVAPEADAGSIIKDKVSAIHGKLEKKD